MMAARTVMDTGTQRRGPYPSLGGWDKSPQEATFSAKSWVRVTRVNGFLTPSLRPNGQPWNAAAGKSKHPHPQDVQMHLLVLVYRCTNNGKLMFPHPISPENNAKGFLWWKGLKILFDDGESGSWAMLTEWNTEMIPNGAWTAKQAAHLASDLSILPQDCTQCVVPGGHAVPLCSHAPSNFLEGKNAVNPD